MNHISQMRKQYLRATLEEGEIGMDPLSLFEQWFQEASTQGEPEPNAMVLSTVSEEGFPAARVVLLKGIVGGQYQFFTNYESQKALEILKNPKVALTFFWPNLERQVRIKGTVTKLSEEESITYFKTRPRESQLGALASEQSKRIPNRAYLQERFDSFANEYLDTEIPMPKNWGGFAVLPLFFEFWQGRIGRLHDRICFQKNETSWERFRVSP